jgi:hypothetical protein
VRGGTVRDSRRAAMRRIGLLALDWVCGDRERWGIDDIWSLPEKWKLRFSLIFVFNQDRTCQEGRTVHFGN